MEENKIQILNSYYKCSCKRNNLCCINLLLFATVTVWILLPNWNFIACFLAKHCADQLLNVTCTLCYMYIYFYAPSFKETGGHIALGLSVCFYVHSIIWTMHARFLAHLSYSDHFHLSVHLCIHPSINIFKRLLLWSPWTDFAQISYGASLGWRNKRLLKWLRFIDQDDRHAHIW